MDVTDATFEADVIAASDDEQEHPLTVQYRRKLAMALY